MSDLKETAVYEQQIQAAADYLRAIKPGQIDVLLILGSGLGALAEKVGQPTIVDYADIPGFPKATVFGHAGKLFIGSWGEKRIAVMQGRFHYYEGHDLRAVTLPIRVMQALDVKTLILTNAAGGMGDGMKAGDLMLITDHISFFTESPLRGGNLDNFGVRFIDQTQVYAKSLGALAQSVAAEQGTLLHQGVYCFCKGPQFETPAEIRMLKLCGASAAGMSTVPEAIVAVHGGMSVLGLTCITNLASGLSGQPLSHQEVLEVGAQASGKMIDLLSGILDRI
ncbi:MAG: purine-nucleoside phosphorylase [Eubacteriales bacterium]|nr:purine-nucleoside phosphorylase [Eubacteriales bacterium]